MLEEMLDKSNKKISVLNKMIGLGEEVAPLNSAYIVPHNSILNLKSTNHAMGVNEKEPTENKCNLKKNTGAICKCPHCENMAKNFLYLESLIRSNSTGHNGCNVCHSSLQYLQHINKSILKVFGNFDAVAEAAKAFAVKGKAKKALKLKTKSNKKLTSSNHSTGGKIKAAVKKQHTVVKKVNTSKKTMGSLNSFGKSTKGNLKKIPKTSSFIKQTSTHSAGKSQSIYSTTKPTTKGRKLKALTGKTRNLFRKLKSIR